MIKSRWEINRGERARKYYNLLDKGFQQLFENKEEWLLSEKIFTKIWE